MCNQDDVSAAAAGEDAAAGSKFNRPDQLKTAEGTPGTRSRLAAETRSRQSSRSDKLARSEQQKMSWSQKMLDVQVWSIALPVLMVLCDSGCANRRFKQATKSSTGCGVGVGQRQQC